MDLKTRATQLLRSLDEVITDHAEVSFPILMIMLGGIGLIAVAVGWWLWKILGLLAIAYAVREFRRCMKARKAGEVYIPASAKIAYVVLLVALLWVLWYVVFGITSPEYRVKNATLEGFDYSIGYLVEHNLDHVKWKTEKEDGETYVYAHGTSEDDEKIILEFRYTKGDGQYLVEVTDGSIDGSWGGWLTGIALLSAMEP